MVIIAFQHKKMAKMLAQQHQLPINLRYAFQIHILVAISFKSKLIQGERVSRSYQEAQKKNFLHYGFELDLFHKIEDAKRKNEFLF